MYNAVLLAFNGAVPDGLVLKTDNGTLYNLRGLNNYRKITVDQAGIYIQKHCAEDNGVFESFHSSIKPDYIWPKVFRDFHEASIEMEKAFTDYNECRII